MMEVEGEDQRPKKRPRNPKKHKRTEAKKARNSGKLYINRSGNNVNPKIFQNIDCECRKKCHGKINIEQRRAFHESFWEIGDFGRQNAFLCGLVQCKSVERHRPRTEEQSPRGLVNLFYLNTPTETIQVCKKYFLDTFNLSDGRVTRALQKFREGKSPGSDLRGNKPNPRATPIEVTNFVKQHIESFPHHESHYTRAHNPNKKYLNENLDVTKMYDLYIKHCADNGQQPVKISYYRHIFNSQYNLGFHAPNKDTCKRCDEYKVKKSSPGLSLEEIQCLENDHELHLRKADKARKLMNDDKELSKTDESLYVCSVDMQKALPFPILTVSDAYYKRNMYSYNVGVHEFKNETAYCYVWDETRASRGSQEISSCLKKHFDTCCRGKKHIIIYSDTCGGQNRNINVALSLMKYVESPENSVEVIEQKFLVSGHSFLPNDRDFGAIEVAAKKKQIFVPNDWYSVIASAKRRNKILVCEMTKDDFYSTSQLKTAVTRRKKNTRNEPVNWLHMQHIRFEKNLPFQVLYKETLSDFEDFKVLDLTPAARRGRPRSLQNIEQTTLYPFGLKITEAKRKDMADLLSFIPPIHHPFFMALNSEEAPGSNPTAQEAEVSSSEED